MLIESYEGRVGAARRKGKRLGRPRVQIDVVRARETITTGAGLQGVAKQLGVGVATLSMALAE